MRHRGSWRGVLAPFGRQVSWAGLGGGVCGTKNPASPDPDCAVRLKCWQCSAVGDPSCGAGVWALRGRLSCCSLGWGSPRGRSPGGTGCRLRGSTLRSTPLETAAAVSISAEREVPSPICEGGGNNTSRFVVGSYAATRIGSFKLDNSPLSEAQILIYQMRKPKLLSWKDLNPCVQTGEPIHLTITLPAASRSRVRVYSRPPPSSRALCSPTLLWALKSGKYQRVIVGIANWAAGVPNFSPRSATNLCVILGLSVLL